MKEESKKSYITVTHGMRGYFAVQLWWNPEGFWEPYQTGIGSYLTKAAAEPEAKQWAEAEEMEYKP